MTEASRAGFKCSGARVREISERQSGIIRSYNLIHRGYECAPDPALLPQYLSAGCGGTVVPAAALVGFLHPPAIDPATPLQTVEQWIKRSGIELEFSRGTLLDQFADLVAVPRP